jgi:hypothetical protein
MMAELLKLKSTGSIDVCDENLTSYFDSLITLDKDDRVFDGRCKFCKSPIREEGELEWEQKRSFKSLVEFFKKNGESMSVNNVRNHIRTHYMKQEQMIMRRHYSERMLVALNHKINKLKKVELLLAMLEDKIWKYASFDHEDEFKSLKCDEMMIKIAKEMSSLLKIQAELEGDLKPVQIVVDRFQNIFVNVMSKIDDPKLKMEMTKELEELKEITVDSK